jgi:two-component sensor histidine kinase/ligand-binding sensor domain-containing protein
MKYYLFIIAFLGFTSAGIAQRYDVKRYSVNEGMPSGQVYDIEFDEVGFAWLATAYGVVRTDGINFFTIGEEQGLKEETISDLFIDSEGNFWVASIGQGVGLIKEDTVVYLQDLSFLNDKDVNYITESPLGKLWFGTSESGIYSWERKLNKVDSLNSSNSSLPSNTVWDIFFDDSGFMWISTQSGLAVLDRELKQKINFTEENGLNGFAAYQTYETSNGNKWIASTNGVTIVKPDFSTENISEINGAKLNYVYNIIEDDHDHVWIGTERDGVFWYTEEESRHITKKNGLSSNFVYRFEKDEHGNIWVATDGDGVTIFKDMQFQIFDSNSDYGANEVYGVHKAKDGTLWFANGKGLTSFKNGIFETFEFPVKYENAEVWEIKELQNGTLVLLSYERSLFTFDGTSFSDYKFETKQIPVYNTDILIEEDGTLVLSGEEGLLFIRDNKVDTVVTAGKGYWDRYVNIIYKDKEGIYWLGTENGIVEYKNGKQTRYSKKEGVEGASVYEIKEDELGNIWFGTNKGITVFTKLKEPENPYLIRTFETDKNYLTETIFIQFDSYGGLWQGTNAGLNYYNLHDWDESGKTKSIHYSLQGYGRGIEFNGSSSLIDNEGDLWFGTAENGVVKYNFTQTSGILKQDVAPKLFFNDVFVNGEVLDISNSDQESIELNFDENNIEIDFGVLNFKDPQRVAFKHKLEGFDTEFVSDGDDNTRLYTNLEPGQYTFQVYARSPGSDWNKEPLSIDFIIKQPYWLQWWFITLSLMLLITALYLIVKFRVAYLEKKKLKELVDEQTIELQGALEEKEVLIKEIHHRVKNNLAVISGLLEMQSWTLENEEAKKALNESKLRVLAIAKIHENLYQNKNLGKIDFEVFLKELKNGVAATMQVSGKVIEIDLKVKSNMIRIDQAIPCGLIINELLTNAFKHAFEDVNEGKIEIYFEEKDEFLCLQVRDNGKGIDKDILKNNNSSLGITLIESLVLQLDAEFNIKNDKGAVFEIEIPITA